MPIEEFLRTADLLPEAMLLVSGGGVVVAANKGMATCFGIAPDTLRGRRLTEVVADAPESVAAYLRACSRTRGIVPGTLRIAPGGEGPRTCRAEGAIYRPRAGDADALILIRLSPKEASLGQFLALNQRIDTQSREIRRRKRAEEELREQREWLRVTLASIGDAVIATDPAGAVAYMNPIAEALTGWPGDEAIGTPVDRIFRIINEETREPVESPIDRVLREGVVVGLANHTVLVARDGTERSIDDTAAPIREAGGELKGVVLVFHDIGVRRALERELHQRAEKLAEAHRRKDEFLAMLAHELRNPLAPTLNALGILRTPGREDADVEWATEVMERQVRHMVRLVDDLLDVSRITHGKVELRKEPVELARIVADAVAATRPLFEVRRHELRVSLPGEPIPLEADPARMQQVLANLLNNAAKYTEEGGRVWLEAERRGEEVVLRVRDNGVGIAPELLPSVFDLFVQADHSLARTQGGLGIGLTLVHSLVGLHGGTVSVRSEGVGHGSEFAVRLPVASSGPPGPAGPPPGRPRAEAGCRRILVVDDNEDSARTLARLLGRWGHDVRVSHDGPAAIEAVRASRPDVVLLDIGLPGLDGYAVARRLRAELGHEGLLLIALTGYGQDADRKRSRDAGFDHHLVKPVDMDRLEAILGKDRGTDAPRK